jgi:MEDS: MEthanogen/methylotroph, DcmR Sensory domain
VVSGVDDLGNSHVVQFYEHGEELADRVASYLRDVLDGRGVAIVIATAAHRQAIQDRLSEAGADLAAAAGRGDYVALDAEGTMAAFTTAGITTGTTTGTAAGRIDQTAFERVIGGMIASAARDGRPVRVYGEMVALLWQDGLVDDAVRLEQLWNELGRKRSFSLLCSYPADTLAGDGHLEAFAEMCRLHDEVTGGGPAPTAPPPGAASAAQPPGAASTARPPGAASAAAQPPGAAAEAPGAARAFALSRDAPAAARHFAVAALRRLGAGDLSDDAALVVTELAANAVRHAGSGFTLTLSCQPEVLRISVRDTRPLPSGPVAAALPPEPLHGLGAVDVLASRGGVEPLGHAGKSVWVELPR